MNKHIYIIYFCNKQKDLTRPAMVTTSIQKAKMFIAKEIENGCVEYMGTTGYKAAKKFKHAFIWYKNGDINNNLKYCFFDYCYDGEEI